MASIDENIVDAVTYGSLKMLKSLLRGEKLQEIDTIKNSEHAHLLHIAAYEIESCGLEIAAFLVGLNAKVNVRDSNLETPLMIAIQHYDTPSRVLSICKLFIKHGAEVNVVDKQGNSALHHAVNRRTTSTELVKMLLKYGACPTLMNIYDYVPFTIALEWHNEEIQEVLFDCMGNFSIPQADCESLLQCAIRNDSPFIVKMLEKGADVNAGHYDFSSYDYCLKYRRLDILRLIIDDYKDSRRHPQSMISRLFSEWNRSLRKRFDTVGPAQVTKEELAEFVSIVEGRSVQKFVKSLMEYEDYHVFIGALHSCARIPKNTDELVYYLTKVLIENGFAPTFSELITCFQFRGFTKDIKLMIENDDTMDCEDLGKSVEIVLDAEGCRLLLMLHVGQHARRDCIMTKILDLIVSRGDSLDCFQAVEQVLSFTYDSAIVKFLVEMRHQYMANDNKTDNLKFVPSLVDLSRNVARNYICDFYKINTFKQFYNVLKKCDLSGHLLDLLKFRTVLYDVNFANYQITKL